MNAGEGVLSPYGAEAGADIVFQIGTAKYGVHDEQGNLSTEKLKAVAVHTVVKIIVSGKLIVPSKVAWALALGADFVVSARGHMFALGCIQAMQCNKDTCPTGITTHNERLQRGLNVEDKAQRVANYNKYIHYGAGLIAYSCGVTSARELKRKHVRIVQESGLSEPLDKMYEHYH